MKLKKRILVLALATVVFLFFKESGVFSNLLPNFTSVCLGGFLLPEDQRITVDNIVNDYIRSGWKSSYELESRILSLRPFSCFLIERYITLSYGIAFTDVYHPDQPPNIYSIYPLKSMKYLKTLELPLAKGANGDLRPLENLTELEYLILSYDNQKLDLSPIKKLKKLRTLILKKSKGNGVPLSLYSILVELPNLKRLIITDPDFVDIKSISNFQNLRDIYLTVSPDASFTPLLNLNHLENLQIRKTKGARCPKFQKTICSVN